MRRRTFIKWLSVSSLASLIGYTFLGERKSHQVVAKPRMGINLGSINYYNSEWPLTDLFKQASGIGPDQEVVLDEDGEVIHIPEGKRARRIIYIIDSTANPQDYVRNGQYVLAYEGDQAIISSEYHAERNTLAFEEPVTRIRETSNSLIFEIKDLNQLTLTISSLHPEQPLRKLSIRPLSSMTGHWHPDFLSLLSGFSCIRFMDTMATNNAVVTTWESRPQMTAAVYSDDRGCPLELLVDLANQSKIDPWFCIPHAADDQYVRQLASYLLMHLDPNLKAYIEYSNETWNGGFKQAGYIQNQAKLSGFSDSNHYAAARSLQTFKIFDSVFGAQRPKRIVRVIAAQAAWSEVAKMRLRFKECHLYTDALAIAPYFGINVTPENVDQFMAWSIEECLEVIRQRVLKETLTWIEQHQAIAQEYGLHLIAYEGGQHMVGVQGIEHREEVTQRVIQLNQHPLMGVIYQEYLKAWALASGDLFCHYSFIGGWSKWGAWSLLTSKYQSPEQSPKWLAVTEWAKRQGQKWSDSQ